MFSAWLQIVSAVGQIEGFIDQGKIRHDVVDDGMLDQRPVLPGWIVWMTASNHAVVSRLERKEYRAAPALEQARAHAAHGRNRNIDKKGTVRQPPQYARDEADGFDHFLEAHRDPRCDVPFRPHGLLWRQPGIRLPWQI